MISEIDFFPFLKNEFPALTKSLDGINDTKSPYQLMRLFTQYTLYSIENKQIRHTEKCLAVAEIILEEGECVVQKAMEMIFIPCLTPVINSGGIVVSHLPVTIHDRCKKYGGVVSN
jgi:hypothetical protein